MTLSCNIMIFARVVKKIKVDCIHSGVCIPLTMYDFEINELINQSMKSTVTCKSWHGLQTKKNIEAICLHTGVVYTFKDFFFVLLNLI